MIRDIALLWLGLGVAGALASRQCMRLCGRQVPPLWDFLPAAVANAPAGVLNLVPVIRYLMNPDGFRVLLPRERDLPPTSWSNILTAAGVTMLALAFFVVLPLATGSW